MGVQEKFDYMLGLVTGSNDPVLLKSVMEVQRELISIQEENRNLRSEIHDLKNESIIESEMVFRDGVYLKVNDVFCSTCWDRDKKLVRVRKYSETASQCGVIFYCDTCKEYRYSDLNSEDISKTKLN